MSQWRTSPYPDGREWAFTIVHDADDAYSERLAPVIDAFDRYGIRTSITAFTFWAKWAAKGAIWSSWMREDAFRAPRAVPLEHASELAFYQSLVERGHEVGLHSASDTDDTREVVERAFAFFRSEFGKYPAIYVEHRDNRQNQQILGSVPDSPYFIADLLNRYQSWVWVVSPSAIPYNGIGRYYDVLSRQRPWLGWRWARLWGTAKQFLKTGTWSRRNGKLYEMLRWGCSPFDRYAREKYGLIRAFRRAGRIADSHGEGFLEWYQDRHLEELQHRGGLAIVYTHLNTLWLDRGTRCIRPCLEERLAAIASRDPWKATASAILDRFSAVEKVLVVDDGEWVKVVNEGDLPVEGLTLIAPDSGGLIDGDRKLSPNSRGKVIIGVLNAKEMVSFRKG